MIAYLLPVNSSSYEYWINASTASEAIILGIAERTDADLEELPTLFEAIEPDALDRLMQGRPSCRVTFYYVGYEITVSEPVAITAHGERVENAQGRVFHIRL